MFYLFLIIGIICSLWAFASLVLMIRVWIGQLRCGFWMATLYLLYISVGSAAAVWAFTQMSSLS